MIAHIIWAMNLVGTGIEELVTGYGLPLLVLAMLVLVAVLPSVTERIEGHRAKSLLDDIGQLLQIGIIGGFLGSLAQLLVWRRTYDLKDVFTGYGWPLVFLILLVATVTLVLVVNSVRERKMGLVASTFSFFVACTVFTVFSAIYVFISLSDTTEDCLHHVTQGPARDSCILEHGTGADCDLIEDRSIRDQCYIKHARPLE